MRTVWLEVRRAPVRIVTSALALALAIGAIGVLAVPTVSTASLRDAAARDGLPEISLAVSDTGGLDLSTLVTVDNVRDVDGQVVAHVAAPDDTTVPVLGKDLANQAVDVVAVDAGRLPMTEGEVVVSSGLAGRIEPGSTVPLPGEVSSLTVVGVGGTSSWLDEDVVFSDLETARRLAGVEGANRLAVRTEDTSVDALRATADDLRRRLADEDVVVTDFPSMVPNGAHPIEDDIEQVSSLIGLLGAVAGLVALVLLGSTVNTLIAERTREVAVMRALGARSRALRRRLRRLAVGIAAAGAVAGIPIGIVVANVIARMVLEEFVGITPGVALSVPVVVGSALFALVGARLVAARAARRVTHQDLAEALRDRDGRPFGGRFGERAATRARFGSLLDRAAWRNGIHQRARSSAILAQVAAAVAALVTVSSLATSVDDFNASENDGWNWVTQTVVPGSGLDIETDVVIDASGSEAGVLVTGEIDGWSMDVHGLAADTSVIDRRVDAGRWFDGPAEAVVATGFAERTGVEVGDRVELLLASGTREIEVVGLHPVVGRVVLVERGGLAAALGEPGLSNVVYSFDEGAAAEAAALLAGPTEVARRADASEDEAARDAIVGIFTAIGVVVVTVAGLAVTSALAADVHERRRELAALQAIGGRRRHLFRIVLVELVPLAAVGLVVGLGLGYIGAAGIMASFEASNAVELGFTFATGAILPVTGVVTVGVAVIAGTMVRRVTRRPAAVTLRSAT